jgi:hypothetical protein
MASVVFGAEWHKRHGVTPRKGWVEGGIAYLPLTKGKVAILTPAFLPGVEMWNWCFSHGYAVRNAAGTRIYLHHEVISMADSWVDGYHLDHVNGNPLDNRIENLRFVTRTENQINRRLQSNNTSGYRGIALSRGKWIARLKRGDTEKHLGSYDTAEDAARAYDVAAKEYGKIYRLNFED